MAKTGYIGVDDTAKVVSGMYVGVDGFARKVKKAYIGVNGVAKEWYSSGKKLSSCAIGEIVQLSENGTNVEYLVVHQGLPSSMYDESCNGTWLVRNKLLKSGIWNNGDANYAASTMHSYLNDTFLESFSSTLQDKVLKVKIPYRPTGNVDTIKSGKNGLSTKIFALSGYEVGFTPNSHEDMMEDGAKLDYFTTSNSLRVAKYGNSAKMWWLRTPLKNVAGTVYCVNTNGAVYYTYPNNTSNSIYYRPTLIMNGDTLLDPNTNTIL